MFIPGFLTGVLITSLVFLCIIAYMHLKFEDWVWLEKLEWLTSPISPDYGENSK